MADVVTECGFSYLACPTGIDQPPRLGQTLSDAVGGRSVAALLLLDVLETSADWPALLDGVHQAVLALSRPVLIVGVRNLANLGNAAGLLLPKDGDDQSAVLSEPLSGWTARQLENELRTRGWVQIGSSDIEEVSREIPDLGRQAPLTMFLRGLRALADATGDKSTLLRSFALSASLPSRRAADVDGAPSSPAPFISVAVRTQGRRQPMLLEALTCLAAQTDDDFEVLLVVHSSDEETVDAVIALVDRFDPQFRDQVRVIPVSGGGRSRPLNTALDFSRGTYLTFLDDDDLVTASWVETFHGAAMASAGSVIRSVSAERRVQRTRGQLSDYEPRGGLTFPYPAKFDLIGHLIDNSSPICSVALPLAAIRRLSVRFDDQLDALEDWDVLMRVAPFAGVVDTGEPTSIYHRWDGDESSSSTVSPTAWLAARHTIRKRLDHLALLCPPGTVSALVERHRTDEDWERRRAELMTLHATVADLSAQLHEIRSSEWWRVTMPIRALGTKVRRGSRMRPPQSGD